MKRRKMFNLKCTKHSIFAIFPTYIMSTCYVAKCFSKLFKRKGWHVQTNTYRGNQLLPMVTTHPGDRAPNNSDFSPSIQSSDFSTKLYCLLPVTLLTDNIVSVPRNLSACLSTNNMFLNSKTLYAARCSCLWLPHHCNRMHLFSSIPTSSNTLLTWREECSVNNSKVSLLYLSN